MSESGDGAQTPPERKREKFSQYLQKSYNKGELALKHAMGLGATTNVVPAVNPSTSGPPRPVEVGWHPVGGFAGKWFAEKTGLGKMITDKINEYPDPTQHWAVLVGDYAHQLWMDENFDVIYTNAKIDPKEWRTFQVGETCFNDDAVRRAGEAVIAHIRSIRPGYNLISNNCQTYVLQLLDAIKVSQVKEFGTTLAVYDRLFGEGKVADLFVDGDGSQQPQNPLPSAPPAAPIEEQETGIVGSTMGHVPFEQQPPIMPAESGQNGSIEAPPQNSVLFAQQVMNANTTQLSAQEQMARGMDESEAKESKEESWTKRTTSFFQKLKK